MSRAPSSPAGRGSAREARRSGPGGSWATGLALFFLLLTLLSLALVPGYLDRNVDVIQDEVFGLLEPARDLVMQIESSQSRQIALVQTFVLSGDSRFRQRYRVAREEEERANLDFQRLVDSMSLEPRARLATDITRALTLSFSWHLGHQDLLNLEVSSTDSIQPGPGPGYRDRLAREQAVYEEVVTATQNLRDALAEEARRGQARIARARAFQLRLTRVLVLAGLAATLLVVGLGWRMRNLMRESETRRLETLQARREADALLRATGDGVLGMDRAGKCTSLNRAGVELLGYPARMVLGRDVHELLHHSRPDGSPLPREECPVVAAMETGETLAARGAVLWRAGREPFPVQLSLRPLLDGGEVKGAVMTFTDMTETRAAEAALRQAVQTRDEVLAVVSHDLRNPVGTIVSAAGLLLELDLPKEKVEDQLRAMKRSGERMNRLIQDLLDVARLEAGRFSVHPCRIRIPPLLDEIVDSHGEEAEAKGITLSWRREEGVEEVFGDRDRLVQILTNLVENALKFTPSGGRVEVGVQRDPEGSGALFSVCDNGEGISPEDQKRLFDRFWQVSRRDSGGAGLGLSIVKGLVEAHGGRVWVESERKQGSTFWFFLPDAPPTGA